MRTENSTPTQLVEEMLIRRVAFHKPKTHVQIYPPHAPANQCSRSWFADAVGYAGWDCSVRPSPQAGTPESRHAPGLWGISPPSPTPPGCKRSTALPALSCAGLLEIFFDLPAPSHIAVPTHTSTNGVRHDTTYIPVGPPQPENSHKNWGSAVLVAV